MIDIALDANHDLALTDDLAFVQDRIEVLQSVKIRVLFIKFEWEFDYLLGVPWLDGMFDIRVPQIQKETYIKETILETVGVRQLTSFRYNIDAQNRGALISYTGDTTFGQVDQEISI